MEELNNEEQVVTEAADKPKRFIMIMFSDEGEAAWQAEGVSIQQILNAGTLLSVWATHMLNVRFATEEQRAIQKKMQEQALMNQVAQTISRKKK